MMMNEESRRESEVIIETTMKTPKPNLLKEMMQLFGWINPDASKIVDTSNAGREMILDQADIALTRLEGPKEPVIFDEVFNHPDIDSRDKWREAIHEAFKTMNLHGVWKAIRKSEIPIGS